ncbi:MAG TPA: hypothetical protein DIW86_13370 [Pseudomonas sp.]|nr:hypothetical protein [Pseudomonas sp.]
MENSGKSKVVSLWTARSMGAGLARDGIDSVHQLHRGVCIAGKPAPTQVRSHRGLCGVTWRPRH